MKTAWLNLSGRKGRKTRFDMADAGSFRNTVRIRVNGLLVLDRSLLMVHLMSPVAGRLIWMPPGGGVQFGESLTTTLQREMLEETGIQVTPGPLWYLNEVIHDDVHAMEFYFLCEQVGGTLRTGSDPEYSDADQIIRDVSFLPLETLDRDDIHPAYLRKGFAEDLRKKPGQIFPKFI